MNDLKWNEEYQVVVFGGVKLSKRLKWEFYHSKIDLLYIYVHRIKERKKNQTNNFCFMRYGLLLIELPLRPYEPLTFEIEMILFQVNIGDNV